MIIYETKEKRGGEGGQELLKSQNGSTIVNSEKFEKKYELDSQMNRTNTCVMFIICFSFLQLSIGSFSPNQKFRFPKKLYTIETYSFIFFFRQCLISTFSTCRKFPILHIVHTPNALKELARVFCLLKYTIRGLSSTI